MMLGTESVAACLKHALIGGNENTPDDVLQ
jgi:hypothetical protein